MSHEFRHKDAVAGRVREDEYEHIRQHILNDQATGDMVYASSATQLSGLPIGSTNQILAVTAGKPAWTSGPTLIGKLTLSPSARITTHLEISGTDKLASGEQAIYINFPLETLATNGIWVTLGSTIISGDLTGIRSRVTGNAASAGANVRGAYLEAKAGASKFAAMLEGALMHADYSAGSVTVSGDVRGFTAHISQGSGLNAANLYGGLINIQTRGDEVIAGDDVGLLIRNEAVGGNGRTMDAAIKITDLNMGGATKGFTYGVDLNGVGIATADIRFSNGATLVDDGTDLTLAGSNLVATLNNCVAKGIWTASGTWRIPAVTLNGTVILNYQVFDALSVSLQVNTTATSEGLKLVSTQDGAGGARLILQQISASPAVNDYAGSIESIGRNSVGADKSYGIIHCVASNVTSTAEASFWRFYAYTAGAMNIAMTISGAGALWLDAGLTVGGDITLADHAVTGLRAGTVAINPEVAHRGQFYFTEGAAGVADKLYCIMKGTDNNYSAIQVAIG